MIWLDLINNTDKVKTDFENIGLDISEGLKLIEKGHSKYINKHTREELVEFMPGFFDYLDEIYKVLKDGVVTQEFIDGYGKWTNIVKNLTQEKSIKIYKKYKYVLPGHSEEHIIKLINQQN